jgi:hypothetical protein
MKPGGGGRFSALVDKLEGEGKGEDEAEAVAANAGKKKYGAKKMASWAKAGKKKSAKK